MHCTRYAWTEEYLSERPPVRVGSLETSNDIGLPWPGNHRQRAQDESCLRETGTDVSDRWHQRPPAFNKSVFERPATRPAAASEQYLRMVSCPVPATIHFQRSSAQIGDHATTTPVALPAEGVRFGAPSRPIRPTPAVSSLRLRSQPDLLDVPPAHPSGAGPSEASSPTRPSCSHAPKAEFVDAENTVQQCVPTHSGPSRPPRTNGASVSGTAVRARGSNFCFAANPPMVGRLMRAQLRSSLSSRRVYHGMSPTCTGVVQLGGPGSIRSTTRACTGRPRPHGTSRMGAALDRLNMWRRRRRTRGPRRCRWRARRRGRRSQACQSTIGAAYRTSATAGSIPTRPTRQPHNPWTRSIKARVLDRWLLMDRRRRH